jgi:hypothetical protein
MPERPEASVRPLDEDPDQHRCARSEQSATGEESVLEPNAVPQPLEQRVTLAEVRHRVGAGEDSELDDLRAEDRGRDEGQHRVDLPGAPEDVHRAARQHQHPGDPEQQQDDSRQEVQPARAVEEHEANVPPGVAEALQLRLAGSRKVVDRDLVDGELAPERLEHHLGGELHPRGMEVEVVQRGAAHRPHPAVGVRHLHAEHAVQQAGEDRIAEPAVRPGHRTLVDAAVEPRAEDEVAAVLERVHELPELAQWIRAVGVSHHHVLTAGVRKPREVGAPVAALGLPDHDRSVRGGDLRRAVGRAVVDDDHLAGPAARLDALPGLVDDRADGALLVQARDDDRDLHGWPRCYGEALSTTALTAVDTSTIRALSWSGTCGASPPLPPRPTRERTPRASDTHFVRERSR